VPFLGVTKKLNECEPNTKRQECQTQNGRFIVMNACMAHNCNDIFGSAVIDGFTGHTQLIRFEKSTSFFRTASTKELDPEVDYKWIEDVDTQNWAQISIKAGKLVASKNKN
jgi:hypothetical protein